MNILDLVYELVNHNIEVTICKNDELGIYYDLNLRAKSHMWLYEKDERFYVHMRYGVIEEVGDVRDLCFQAVRCMHGRTFIDPQWASLILLHGFTLGEGE